MTGPAQSLRFTVFDCQIVCDFAESFEGGFEVYDNFLRENLRIGKSGVFRAFISEPELERSVFRLFERSAGRISVSF